MIQYMSCGTAAVASAVGANIDVFERSGAGHLVPSGGDWVEPLVALGANAEKRRAHGAAGRSHVVRSYSVAGTVGRVEAVLRSAAGDART